LNHLTVPVVIMINSFINILGGSVESHSPE